MGKEWDKALPSREAFKQMCRVLKPGALAFVMSSPRQDLMARMILLLEDAGFEMRQSFISYIYKTGFPKGYNISKAIDRKLGLEREVTGYRKGQGNIPNLRGEWGLKPNSPVEITEPASDEAKQWKGFYSQTSLKPAFEPILMVNKPFSEKTIVDNVLRWGTGAINVDATRIPFKNEDDADEINRGNKRPTGNGYSDLTAFKIKCYDRTDKHAQGRFPANLLVSDGTLDTGEITQGVRSKRGGQISSGSEKYAWNKGEKEQFDKDEAYVCGYPDSGDQSRYFDLDAWAQHHGFLDVPKPSKAERDFGLTTQPLQVPKSKFNLNDGSKDMRFNGVIPTPRRNIHPTCKPVKLMAYLIELGCPKEGVVLDPFLGSGTTCIAAKQLGRKYIGIEINPEYHVLAEARVAAHPDPLEWFMEAQDVRE